MTRKKYIKMVIAMCEKLYAKQGKHLDGKALNWYRDLTIAKMSGYNSYNDAWDDLKILRDIVEM